MRGWHEMICTKSGPLKLMGHLNYRYLQLQWSLSLVDRSETQTLSKQLERWLDETYTNLLRAKPLLEAPPNFFKDFTATFHLLFLLFRLEESSPFLKS